MKPLSFWLYVFLGMLSFGATLLAQTPVNPIFLQAVTTGMVGFSLNQTAELNVLNANPVAGTTGATATICTVQLEFRDAQGALLKQLFVNNISPGATASLTLKRAEAGSLSVPRLAIRGMVRSDPTSTPPPGAAIPVIFVAGCPVMTTLEIFNDDTGNTQLVTSDTRLMSPGIFAFLQPGH
jgi:hypothetical protein